MKATRLQATGDTTYALIFDKGDEVIHELTDFAGRQRLSAAHFTAIGALSDVTLGYFDRARKDYRRIQLDEQVEVVALLGDVALDGEAPKVHAHVVVGLPDATTRGGHLLGGHVWPTLELMLTETPRHLRRRHDRETGLALIDLEATGRRDAA
ncbi:MAG: PPC domain-containing DNA-binding protein [Candidatus Rokuibacteriota bacterium]